LVNVKYGAALVTDSATNTAGEQVDSRRRCTEATLVYPDATLRRVTLSGDDSAQFAEIGRLVGAPVAAVNIDDQDGSAAVGWVGDGSGVDHAPNAIASAVANRPVSGPMVVTGRGRGDQALTSIHCGLQTVLEQMAGQSAPSVAS
jgi:hypothetical protein